jgi:HEAT repeat protein
MRRAQSLLLAAIVSVLAASLAVACGGAGPGAAPGSGSTVEQPDVQALIAALGDENASARSDAAVALGALGDPRAVDALVAALDDEYPFVRVSAAEALGAIGEPEAVPALIVALGRSATSTGEALGDVQAATAGALAAIGDPRAVKPLVRYAAKEWVADDVVPLLVQMGKPAVKPLIAILGERRGRQAEVAAQALGEIGDARAIKPLVAYGAKNGEVAGAALVAIGKPAVLPLVNALDDEDVSVRRTAADTLGKIGDRRAVKGLRGALADSEDSVWRAASDALALIHRSDVSPLLPWLRSQSTLRVYYGLIGLGKKGTEDELVEALEAFGSEAMAEDYLNCGSERLESAARRWAEAHGYTVFTMPGFGVTEEWGRLS